MRTSSAAHALILSLAIAGAAPAAPKRAQDQSPPTARPDATLVAPDPVPPPPTTPAPTGAVQMQPIGAPGGSSASALLAVANGGQPAAAPAPVLAPLTPPPPAPPPAPPAPPPPPPPAAPAEAPVVARVEQCLRAEAPRAARAEASVKLAVDLLLDDLCGAEVERAALYAHNLDALARFTPQSERAAAGLGGARVDPETGEILNPPAGDVSGALAAAGVGRDLDAPPQIRRFAADLVLAMRAPPPTPPVTKPAPEPRGSARKISH